MGLVADEPTLEGLALEGLTICVGAFAADEAIVVGEFVLTGALVASEEVGASAVCDFSDGA
jgi:hypothetical protein